MKSPKTIVVLLTLASVAAIVFAVLYRVMAGVFLHDSNFDTFQQVLTSDQRRGITWSLDSITASYCWLLAITNVAWLAVAWYLLWKLRLAQRKGA